MVEFREDAGSVFEGWNVVELELNTRLIVTLEFVGFTISLH